MTDGDEAERMTKCMGKEQLSASIAKNIALRHRQRGRSSTAYKCAYCKAWHVGTQDLHIKKGRK